MMNVLKRVTEEKDLPQGSSRREQGVGNLGQTCSF